LQRKDIVGADPQWIVRLGRHLDGNLGAVGQDATGTGIALIRGGDAQVVLTPEVPGWLVVQVACQQTVEIIERPDQGHHAGPRPCTETAPAAPSRVSTPCSTRSTMEMGALPASTSFTLIPVSDRSHPLSPAMSPAPG
jgi:hypothetical protein